jgi:hypothetical protein
MRKLLIFMFTALFCIAFAAAEDQTWSGKISDSKCAASHKAATEHASSKMSDHDCTVGCVKGGAKYVFVSKGKVYQIDNQDYAGLEEHAGHTVQLTGSMTGDTVHVSDVKVSGKKT